MGTPFTQVILEHNCTLSQESEDMNQ